MRHIKFKFFGSEPSDKDLYTQLRTILGSAGIVNAEVRVEDGVVSCNRKWVNQVKGALALKWQFIEVVSGTKNLLKKKKLA